MTFLLRLARFARAFLISTPVIIDGRTGRTFPIIAGGAPDGDGDGDGEAGGTSSDDDAGAAGSSSSDDCDAGSGDYDDDDDTRIDRDDDWRTKARKHEHRARRDRERAERERKARERAERERDELKRNQMSEQERAVAEAEDKGRREAKAEAEAERRADRLELAVTRQATRGVTVGDGDDAEVVKFADADDALLRIQRAIDRGELEDIFGDDGRVDADALETALTEIATEHPHLTGKAAPAPAPGDPDTRKGGAADGSLEAMTPEDHAKRKYGRA